MQIGGLIFYPVAVLYAFGCDADTSFIIFLLYPIIYFIAF